MTAKSMRNKGADDVVARPPIWVKGKQRPSFDLAGFAHVSYDIAKRDLAPALTATARTLGDLAQRVTADPSPWPNWAARALPGPRVAAAAAGLSQVVADAATRLSPPAPEAPPATAAPARRPEVTPTEPTLAAIRQAIRQAPADMPHFGMAAQPAPHSTGRKGWLLTTSALGLLALAMVVALPLGAVKALLFHLDGGDLRDWS